MSGTFAVNLNVHGIPLDNSQWSSDFREIYEWNYKNCGEKSDSNCESDSDYENDIHPSNSNSTTPIPGSSLEFLQTILNSLDTFTFHPLPSYKSKSSGKVKSGEVIFPPLDIRHTSGSTSGRSLFKVVSFNEPPPELESKPESRSETNPHRNRNWDSSPQLRFALVDSLGRILLKIEPLEDYRKWPGPQLFLNSSQGSAGHILCSDPTLRNFRYGVRSSLFSGERLEIVADGRLVACHCCWWCPISPPGIEFVGLGMERDGRGDGDGDGTFSGAGRSSIGKMNRIDGDLKLQVCPELGFMHKLWMIVICWHAAGVQPWL